MIRFLYEFLSSAKLTLVLLVVILACCIVGVTVVKGVEAGRLIFGTLWFNSLLVLLVVNVAFCFFPRMWGRKITIVSLGMILFHLSFVAILAGIVYNSLFCFRGLIRLTEGELLRSGLPESYDAIDVGRFFKFSSITGETGLVRMHAGYKVGSEDKRAAYEVEVGERGNKKQGIIYITQSLAHEGFSYFNDREGYSLLVILYDKQGKELYGAHFPLQSLQQKEGTYLYTTGTRDGPGQVLFPQKPFLPLYWLQMAYRPDPVKDRAGEVAIQLWDSIGPEALPEGTPLVSVKKSVGEKISAGEYLLEVREVRYWVMMLVRHEPGKPIVLTGLWVGLSGLIITFIGRMMKRSSRPTAGS